MYINVSVTVSWPVVRDMDKAFQVLELIRVVGGAALDLEVSDVCTIANAANTIEKLFLWTDDTLGDEGEFQLLLCRKLAWYEDVLETLKCVQGLDDNIDEYIVESYISEVRDVLLDVANGNSVDVDSFDEITQFCLMLSETIWEHFVAKYLEVAHD